MGYATVAHHNIVQRLKSKLGASTVSSIIEKEDIKPVDRVEVRAKKIVLLFAPEGCNSYELVYDYIANTPGVIDINGMKYLYYYKGKVCQLKDLIPLCDGPISAPTLRSRLDTMSIDDALRLGTPMPSMARSRSGKITYLGKEYKAHELAMMFGVDLKTLTRHVHKTPVIDKPLRFFRRNDEDRFDRDGFILYSHAGKQYTLLALAKELDIEPKVLYRLLRVKKMFIEDVIEWKNKE
jgi:hypothetical protein